MRKRKSRADFGNVAARTKTDGSKVYRARWACPACQEVAEESWRRRCYEARQSGVAEPPKPRSQHSSTWQTSKASAEALLEEVRIHKQRLRLAGMPQTCYVDEAFGDGTQEDERVFGQQLQVFAERVLSRTTGAEQTRQKERSMWDESLTIPSISEEPLGLGERFGARGVRDITRQEVRAWLMETTRRPGKQPGSTLSASQVRQRFYLLHKVLLEAIASDALEVDPCLGLKPPPLPQGRAITGLMRREKDRRWLPSEEQVKEIVALLPTRSRLAVAMLFGAGLRAGEVTALERHDLVQHGPQRWTVSITKSESQSGGRPRSETKTGEKGQAVRHLPEWVGALVEEHLETYDLAEADRLFPPVGKNAAASLSHTCLRNDLGRALDSLSLPALSLQDLRAAGEASVAAKIGRPAAAEWARHSLAVQMGFYVAAEAEKASVAAAGWG